MAHDAPVTSVTSSRSSHGRDQTIASFARVRSAERTRREAVSGKRQAAMAQATRLADLIDDISLLTKIEEAGNLYAIEEVNVNELIGDIIGLLQSPARNVISALQSGGQTISGIVKTLSERPE